MLSLGLVIFVFSLTFMMGSILLKPYIALEPADRDFIVILCIINIGFSLYYVLESTRLEKIFSLEDHHIEKFGKRIGIVTTAYMAHFIVFLTLLFRDLHNLQVMMIYLIIFMELCLISSVFKEVYDLLFLNESERRYEFEANRQRYIEREKKPHPDEFR